MRWVSINHLHFFFYFCYLVDAYHYPVFRSSLLGTETDSTEGETEVYTDAASKDRIIDLPGLDHEPNFNQFSGYLKLSDITNRSIFYWYVESQSNPSTDPVVLWTNGGPGCSGLIGFGAEHGPFFYSSNGTLTPNPYSWNKVANMLYIEQPAGVGFSFSDNEDDYVTGDKKAADDNYLLIKKFFEKFPERKGNDFYITSESYGGHYIPQLTKKILTTNVDGAINFRGFAVGNPYVDPFSNDATMIEAFYAHGLVSRPVYKPWYQNCRDEDNFSENCDTYTEAIWNEAIVGINPYALDFPICLGSNSTIPVNIVYKQRLQLLQYTKNHIFSSLTVNYHASNFESHRNLNTKKGDKYQYDPCELDNFSKYINRDDVRSAIHVHRDKDGVLREWNGCSDSLNYSETDADTSIIQLYKEVIALGLKHDLNMLVYSGDDDSICCTASTQYWIYDLGWDTMDGKLWKPWKVDGQVAGFVTSFQVNQNETDTQGSFSFMTVHGAGHEVPIYKPVQALKLFMKFLGKEW